MIRFLQSGNKAAKYILSIGILLLAGAVVVSLIPGFLNSVNATSNNPVVATVAGDSIRAASIVKLAQRMGRQMAGGRSVDPYMPFLIQRALQQKVQEEEIRYEAHRLGLEASDAEVRDELQNGMYKQYFYPGGKWIGQTEYVALLTQDQQTPEEFETQVRDMVLERKLYQTVTSGISVTPSEVEQNYKDKNLKVKFQYAILNVDDVQKGISPTEADLKGFYEKNQARYQNSIPEKRQLRYIVLLDTDAESKIAVSAAEIQGFYTANLDQFRMPDRVRVRHILIKTPAGPDGKPDQKTIDEARAKAGDVLAQLKAGGNFAELAKKYSQDTTAEKGGELGWSNRGQFVPEFEKVAYTLGPGQISDLVQSPFGFHIIQGEEKDVGRVKPLADVKDEIEKSLKSQRVGAIQEQQANAAADTAKKQGLDKAAAQAGTRVLESNLVGRNDSLAGVGPAPELMAAVFSSQDKGPQLQRFVQGNVIYQVTKIEPPRTPSFDEIKDRITKDFKNERGYELLQKKAEQMSEHAHTAHDLAKAAKEAGATVKTSELVDRSSQVPDVGSMNAARVAFSLKPGEISGPISLGQKAAVLQVTERQEASVTDPQFVRERDSIMEQLSQDKRQQVYSLFLSDASGRMEKEGKIKYNKAEAERLPKAWSSMR